jgi:esterase/lipase superfamily enzyme
MAKIYFATNRDLIDLATGEFGERFNAEGPQFYRVGHAELDPDPSDTDHAYTLRKVVVEPETPPADLSGRGAVFGSSALFKNLRAEVIAGGRDIVVLIHGFACKFTDSMKRAAQIKGSYLVDRGDGAKAP